MKQPPQPSPVSDPPAPLPVAYFTDGESPKPPLRSDDPNHHTSPTKPSTNAIVAVEKEKFHTPMASPFPITPPTTNNHHPAINMNSREVVWGGEKKGRGAVEEIVRRSKAEEAVKKAALGFRVGEFVLCLISFSVMAADKSQGWTGDSFDRYKEYRFCVSVNVIGFVYAAFQAYNLAYHLVFGKHVIKHHIRHHFDFLMDQILAYLLISAASAGATRVDIWQSSWGKDKFTEKASVSLALSFLGFIAFATSSIISGYNLCSRDFS